MSVSNSVLFWLQLKNAAASFKLLIWHLENWYWKIHQVEGAFLGVLRSLFKLILLQNTVNLNYPFSCCSFGLIVECRILESLKTLNHETK